MNAGFVASDWAWLDGVNAGFVASDWAWLDGPVLGHWAWDLAAAIGGRVPDAVVTFEPGQEALGAWQEVKGEAMSVNEALYAGRKLMMV